MVFEIKFYLMISLFLSGMKCQFMDFIQIPHIDIISHMDRRCGSERRLDIFQGMHVNSTDGINTLRCILNVKFTSSPSNLKTF